MIMKTKANTIDEIIFTKIIAKRIHENFSMRYKEVRSSSPLNNIHIDRKENLDLRELFGGFESDEIFGDGCQFCGCSLLL